MYLNSIFYASIINKFYIVYVLVIFSKLWVNFSNASSCQPRPLTTSSELLPIDCMKYNFTGSACYNYVAQYLAEYTASNVPTASVYEFPDIQYSSYVQPQDTIFCPMQYFKLNEKSINQKYLNANTTCTTLQVHLLVQILKVDKIDEVPSTLSASIMITLGWQDPRLTWNQSLTPLVDDYCTDTCAAFLDENNVQVSSVPVWYPALTLLNSASDDANVVNKMIGFDRLLIYPSGLVRWRLAGNVITYCNLNLRWYPFDTQKCTMEFTSRANYIINGVNFTIGLRPTLNQPIPVKDIFSASFQDSSSWTTVDATVERIESVVTGSAFQGTQSIIVYTLSLKRNYKNIVVTSIIPNVLVAILSIASLWLEDFATRLGLNITALLAIMAILVG